MFAGLINHAKSAASGLIGKYVARASVAIPFIIAFNFGLAATTVMLVERFGHVTAYWMVAGGLALVGIIAAIVVSVREQDEKVAEKEAEKANTEEVVSEATAQAMVQTPIALLGALFAMPGGATSALSVVRLLGRNWSLVLLLVVVGALFWPSDTAEAGDEANVTRKPNGADDHMPSAMRH